MKLLILVMGSLDSVSENLIGNGIKKTWGNREDDNVRIMYYYGNNNKNEIIGNDILLKQSDAYGGDMINKTLDAFEESYNNIDFDIMFRTNISQYIRVNYLYNVLSKLKPIDLYGSTYPSTSDIKTYLSGAGMVLSKDTVGKIIENRNISNPYDFWEDQAIEHILKHIYSSTYFQNYKSFKRLDILENNISKLTDPLFKIKYGDLFTFRCKTENNRDLDIVKMKLLHSIFN